MSENSVVPGDVSASSESSRDPLSIMIEIAKDENLSDADKTKLLAYAQKKFINRRRMAYTALIAIITSLFLLFLAAFIDGFSSKTILGSIKDSQTLT